MSISYKMMLACPTEICSTRHNRHNIFRRARLCHRHKLCLRALKEVRPHQDASASEVVSSNGSLEFQQADISNQWLREGGKEAKYLLRQAAKREPEQQDILDILPKFDSREQSKPADVLVVGCGPAGLALAAELSERNLDVVLVGMDSKFTNNYGVWVDEFKALGLEETLDNVWQEAICYFGLGKEHEVRIGRAYGRVDRAKLRAKLLERCSRAGVRFLAGEVTDIDAEMGAEAGAVACRGGSAAEGRLIVLASGAVAGKFLEFEEDAPTVAAQTAYGIQARVKHYDGNFDLGSMLFMDYRRHHTGLYDGMALEARPGTHPHGSDGLWGTDGETPSFLYAMPLADGSVFLEETALVARPPLPFSVLKRRLERRLRALGIEVEEVMDEEWSYIPVGGPLPTREQPVAAFGAAANMIHPATGYSVARSLKEAPAFADGIAKALARGGASVGDVSSAAWDALWPMERQRQVSFQVFGMELLVQLGPQAMNEFFMTFFGLPAYFWNGFLASSLSSAELLAFALLFFVRTSNGIRLQLMGHLLTSPSAKYMLRKYTRELSESAAGPRSGAAVEPRR